MQRSRMKEGVEYAVRNNSPHGTLYRASFMGDRVVTQSRREIGYPRRDVDVKCLVFKIEAVITRPYGSDPTDVGGELLVESARYVENTWDVHMQQQDAERARRERADRQRQENEDAITAALKTLGLTVAPLGRYDESQKYDLLSYAVKGTGVGNLNRASVEVPGDVLVRVADMVAELRAALEQRQGWPHAPGPDSPDWPGEARP